MKTKIYSLIALSVLAFSSYAHATVGGPTMIGEFKYNHSDESVYYIERSESGRGCPPILSRISLESEAVFTVFSCNDGEALYNQIDSYNQIVPKVMQHIESITSSMKSLLPLSLKENNVELDVVFDKETYYTDEPLADFMRRELHVDVYQNGTKIDSFALTSCNTEQPFLFQGFAIPGFQKKIVILSSTKSDCVEGGYIHEKLHVVGNMNNVKTSETYRNYKSSYDPLLPNESTIIVLENNTLSPAASTQTTADATDGSFDWKLVAIAVLILTAGFRLGKIKSSTGNTQ